jgi:hypothetical protein
MVEDAKGAAQSIDKPNTDLLLLCLTQRLLANIDWTLLHVYCERMMKYCTGHATKCLTLTSSPVMKPSFG